MEHLEGKKVVVTGGSRGLGLGIVEALVAKGARVTVIAREEGPLRDLARRLDVSVLAGDASDAAMAERVLRELRPSVLVLNAGCVPEMGPLDELTWEAFCGTWNSDVKAGFHWLQAALRLPLEPGSRVLVGSSGAAVSGSPLSGGYAGGKRMLWLMAQYANNVAAGRGLGIHFQAIVPRQMIGDTRLGQASAAAYAKRKGIEIEAFLAGFGAPLPPARVGEHVVSILTDDRYAAAVALGLKGDSGITVLDT
jgi:NAD(P)-dependent dehydrogenase (short-subunit alcohol dehydrogenase family)